MNDLPPPRSDILNLKSYIAGAQINDTIRLNANEAPAAAGGTGLNRYPEIHPLALRNRLASLFDVPAENLLVTRGTSEAIDILIRTWCKAYRDTIVTTPPTFDMYRLYANIQGIEIVEAPLLGDNFSFDVSTILSACGSGSKLVFLCSPNNPTGSQISQSDLAEIIEATKGRSIIVLDEAYIEFSERGSLAKLALQHNNLVVLRTLSKAHGLAGARCGAAIGSEAVINILSKVLPPYSFPTPAIQTVLDILSDKHLQESAAIVASVVSERTRVSARLEKLDCTTFCWPSEANFILVHFSNLKMILSHLAERKILIREFSDKPELKHCARITIGLKEQNDALIRALEDFVERAK